MEVGKKVPNAECSTTEETIVLKGPIFVAERRTFCGGRVSKTFRSLFLQHWDYEVRFVKNLCSNSLRLTVGDFVCEDV